MTTQQRDLAGFSVWGPTDTFALASFDAMFAANVRAPFLLVAAFAPAWWCVGPEASSTSAAWPAASVSPAGRRTERRGLRRVQWPM